MKIAVVGSGISGLTAAWALSKNHAVTIFESGPRTGGHTATVSVQENSRKLAIDTGFIVFNDCTYPEFITLMDSLGVESQPTEMSFSVSDAATGLEYAGSNFNTLFAQRRNLFSPRFLGLLRDVVRFNNQVETHLSESDKAAAMTLGTYLHFYGYSDAFRDQYLVPMGAAIWSARTEKMLSMPVQFLVRFFRNHGLLNITNRPQWRVIRGGSRSYIKPLSAGFHDNIHLNCPVHSVRRFSNPESGVEVRSGRGTELFDQVVFACHSDQALKILATGASSLEQKLLSAIPYERNEVVLHTDTTLLPKNRRCWSSWNVALDDFPDARPRLTYNMNILQGITSQHTYCVSLNQTDRIRQDKILGVYHYDHPIFDQAGLEAQQRWSEINGISGLWFCGAWWRNGFHEDGVWSALRVANGIAALHSPDKSRENAA